MLDNGCMEPNCPVHMRNDIEDIQDFGADIITYVDDICVFTYMGPDENSQEFKDNRASVLILGFMGDMEALKEIDKTIPRAAHVSIHRVGYGALSDADLDNPLKSFEVHPSEVKQQHDAEVAYAKAGNWNL